VPSIGDRCPEVERAAYNGPMDSTSYVAVLVTLFAIIVVILGVRVHVGRRLDERERQKRQEEDARTTSESNSGL
jgi:hypothetical protein